MKTGDSDEIIKLRILSVNDQKAQKFESEREKPEINHKHHYQNHRNITNLPEHVHLGRFRSKKKRVYLGTEKKSERDVN